MKLLRLAFAAAALSAALAACDSARLTAPGGTRRNVGSSPPPDTTPAQHKDGQTVGSGG